MMFINLLPISIVDLKIDSIAQKDSIIQTDSSLDLNGHEVIVGVLRQRHGAKGWKQEQCTHFVWYQIDLRELKFDFWFCLIWDDK